jgi:PAS domain S-box-containing protein
MEEGYIEHDLSGKFTFVNDAETKMLGYSREELVGMSYHQYTSKQTSRILYEVFHRVYETGEPALLTDYEVIMKDGGIRIHEMSITLVRDDSGSPVGFRGVSRDVTERKKAEEALKKSEAKYRFLTENMNDIVWTADLDFNVTYDSPAVEKVLGFTVNERMTQEAHKMLTPDSSARALEVLSEELNREQEEGVDPDRIIRLELEYYHKNSSTVWMECVMSAIRDDSGKIIGIHGVSRDITDRRRAESAITESEKRFRTLIQKSLDIIIILDAKGFMTYETPSLENILGYHPGYLIGKSPFELIHPDDINRVTNDLNEVYLKTNPGIPTEFRFRKTDGTWVYLEAIGQNLLEDPAINGIVITARDITERKRAEEELQSRREQLETLVKERTAKLVKAIEQMEKQIEERKRAEDALRANEEIYRIHFSLSNDVMFTSDEEHRLLSITPNVEKILGYKPNELIGRTFQEMEVLHPDDMGKAIDDTKNVLFGGVSRHPTYRFITKDRKTKFCDVSGVPLIKKGQGATLISVARDVTDRIEKEQALLETLDRFRTHFTLSDDVMFSFDHKLRIKSVSPNVERVFGYKPEDIIGKPGHKVGAVPPEYLNEALDEALHLLSGQTIHASIYEFITKDGKRKFGEVSSSYLKRDGQVVEGISVIRDITERIRKDKLLQESEETTHALVNACTDFMVLIDNTGTIIYINKAASEYLGKSFKELLGTCLFDYLPKEVADRRKIYFEQVISSGKPIRFEDENRGRLINSSWVPIYNEQGKVSRIAIHTRDITELKQAFFKGKM